MRSEEHKDEVMDEVVGRGIPRDRAGNRLGGWPMWGLGRLGVLSVLLISRKTDGGVQPMDCRRRCLRTESGVNQVEREDLNQAMSRLAEGDRSAFEAVYAATWPILSRFTRRTLPHSADADDVAQEALRKLDVVARVLTRRPVFGIRWTLGLPFFGTEVRLGTGLGTRDRWTSLTEIDLSPQRFTSAWFSMSK